MKENCLETFTKFIVESRTRKNYRIRKYYKCPLLYSLDYCCHFTFHTLGDCAVEVLLEN
jgi:hypothetical protein